MLTFSPKYKGRNTPAFISLCVGTDGITLGTLTGGHHANLGEGVGLNWVLAQM